MGVAVAVIRDLRYRYMLPIIGNTKGGPTRRPPVQLSNPAIRLLIKARFSGAALARSRLS